MVWLFGQAAQAEQEQVKQKTILGWVEWLSLEPYGIKTKAKLDTGAKTSSLHAKNIEYLEKDGETWVRFQFSQANAQADTNTVATIEAPLARHTLIKRHKTTSVERPVALIDFSLSGQHYRAEFTLTDRSKFNYPVLLGRRFLKEVAIVDPGSTFLKTQQPLTEPESFDLAQETAPPDTTQNQ